MDINDQMEEFDDELDNIVTLTDEDGNDVDFEFLDVVECDGQEYVVLMPIEEPDAGEVVIFRVEGEGDDESYVGLGNEAEAEKVFAAFKAKNEEFYTFAD